MKGSFVALLDGSQVKCDILHNFKHDNDNYVIYNTDVTTDEGFLEVFASKYLINNSSQILLIPLKEQEWEIVDKEWSQFNG